MNAPRAALVLLLLLLPSGLGGCLSPSSWGPCPFPRHWEDEGEGEPAEGELEGSAEGEGVEGEAEPEGAGEGEGGEGEGAAACTGAQCPETPQCAAQGGHCELTDGAMSLNCPDGSYPPFSGGQWAYCATDAPRICCAPAGQIGAPCTQAEDCEDGSGCLAGLSYAPAGGYCSRSCLPEQAGDCPDWAVCLPVFFSQAPGVCLVACAADGQCRPGLSCQALPRQPFGEHGETEHVCWQSNDEALGLAGLGQSCRWSRECLSGWCSRDPRDGRNKCTEPCGAGLTCMTGYSCQVSQQCTLPRCDLCFPDPLSQTRSR